MKDKIAKRNTGPATALDIMPDPEARAIDWRPVADRWLALKNSPRTKAVYAQALSEFFASAGTENVAAIGLAAFADFRAAIEAAGNTPRTVALKASAVRGFFLWLSNLGLIPFTPAQIAAACPSPRFHKARKESFDSLDLSALREYFARPGVAGTVPGERDRLVISLLLHTGCRVAELAGAGVRDVMLREGMPFLRVTGKGGKERDIDLSADAHALIRGWWDLIGLDPASRKDRKRPLIEGFDYRGEHIFVPGRKLTTRAIELLVKRVLAAAGIDKPLSPHSARHTCARMMVAAGASAFDVQARLGHASVATANEYVTERDAVALQLNRFAPGV